MSSFDRYLYRSTFTLHLLHPKYWGTWLSILILLIAAYTPVKIRDWLALRLTRLVLKVAKKPVHIIDCNLKACFNHLSAEQRKRIVRQNIEIFLVSFLGQGELLFRSRRHILSRYDVKGKEHINELLDNEQQLIFVTTHNWGLEYAGTYFATSGLPLASFINQHKNPVYNWLSAKQRTRYCDSVYVREGGIRVILKAIKQGKHVFYLPDEDHGVEKSQFAPFFNTTKATLPILNRLAKTSQAHIIPLHIGYDLSTHRFNLTIDPELTFEHSQANKGAEAQLLNHLIEDLISRDIKQYMWILRILKTRPSGEDCLYKQ